MTSRDRTSQPPLDSWAARKESPLSGLKQPILGILATALIMAISLGFISLFDFPRFSGWVATFLICIIPMEIVMGVTWGMKQPRFAAERSQPVRGILFSADRPSHWRASWSLAHWTGVGGSISPPTPMLTQCLIASVVITFWLGHHVGRLAVHGADQESDRRRIGGAGGLLRHQLHLLPHLL